jgi:beta-mannosidase
MKHSYDLSALDWTVEGFTPYLWLFERLYGVGFGADNRCIDVPAVPARVPGSVQGALRQAGILPDWNTGMNYRACEWVENRHWIFSTNLPDEWYSAGPAFRLECLGLDYTGWVYVNRREVGTFQGTHIPHTFDITSYLQPSDNVLEIIFDLPPRWLGQFGYTSRMKEWKTRFNYTWDWTPRLLQVGIWDDLALVAMEGSEIRGLRCFTDVDLPTGKGILELGGQITPGNADRVEVTLAQAGQVVRSSAFSRAEFEQGVRWADLDVELWWPNLEGEQPLYDLTCRLLDQQGAEQDRAVRRVGFKHVDWAACEGAPEGADRWQCVINGRPVFLQGVNFAPLCANYADLTQSDYEKRLKTYREMGLNLFRINACQFLERQWFYDLCDELGLMVWQEFPLTSSGLDNWPPEDEDSIAAVAEIAAAFIQRRHHHASLLLWSGGNELQGDLNGQKSGMGLPCTLEHPMLKRLQEVTQALDPYHRYIHTSPAGPRAGANPAEFGQGLHWDVHGGAAMFTDLEEARKYWAADDALFRSEIYCPGASPAGLIQKYAGSFDIYPASTQNPYWTRLTTWWNDWKKMIALHGREPSGLNEYIVWSQAYQATMIASEMRACKEHFPRCGGVLLWSGHDTFPLTINSSLIDFDGGQKPSALAVAEVWHCPPGKQRETKDPS